MLILIILLIYSFLQLNLCNEFINNENSNIYFKINNNDIIYNTFNSINLTEKKNLILGTLARYSWKDILIFFNSLIQANFTNCDIVIFIKNVKKRIRNYLESIGVILFPIPNKYNNYDITKLRWKLYRDYLNNQKNKYNLIFTTDIRDVFFQKDIFQYYNKNISFLGIALEDETLDEKTNKKWITNFVGKEKHKAIKNEKIICFGSVWGSIDIILEFSKILWKRMKFDKNSTDQGIGNYLIYFEKIFKDYIIKSDNFGPVMTIGWNKKENITLDSNDNILNFRGEVAYVIHQYDRHKDISMKIQEKFLYKFFVCSDNVIKKNEIIINKTNNSFHINKNMINYDYYKNIINVLITFEFLTIFFFIKKNYNKK